MKRVEFSAESGTSSIDVLFDVVVDDINEACRVRFCPAKLA